MGYTLALMVCSRVKSSQSLDTALDISEENPNFDDIKPAIANQLGKQFSYFRTRHPELYESHLAELKFESTYPRHHTENSNSHDTSTESGDDEDLGSIKI